MAKKHFDNATIESMYGLESLSSTHGHKEFNTRTAEGLRDVTSIPANDMVVIKQLLKTHVGFESNLGVSDPLLRFMENQRGTHFKLEEFVEKLSTDNILYKRLPPSVQSVLKVGKEQMQHELSALNSIGTESENSGFARRKYQRRYDMAKAGFKSAAFSLFSRIQNKSGLSDEYGFRPNVYKDIRNKMGLNEYTFGIAGMESLGISVPSVVLYARMEANIQYPNATNPVYNRTSRVRQILNDMTAIPINTEIVELGPKDTNGDFIESKMIRRDRLYSYFNHPDHAEMYKLLERNLTVLPADFGKTKFLKRDIYSGMTAPFLSGKEFTKPEITIQSIKYTDAITPDNSFETNEITTDNSTGFARTPAYHELDRKGKVLYCYPYEGNTTDYLVISLRYDFQLLSLMIDIQPQGALVRANIEEIVLGFKIHDVEFVQTGGYQPRIRREEDILRLPAERRLQLQINSDEIGKADERGGDSHLTKLTNATSELITQTKEGYWYTKHMYNHDGLKVDYMNSDWLTSDPILFSKVIADKRTTNSINVMETYGVYMYDALEKLRTDLTAAANTHSVNLNGFCHAYTLAAIRQACSVIIGEVNDVEDGKFLGVEKPEQTNLLTIGKDKDSPVDMVIASNTKNETKPIITDNQGGRIAADEIVYPIYLVPTYKDANIETTFVTETPTKIISSAEYRASDTNIPTLFFEFTMEYQVIRRAYAEFGVKGYTQEARAA